MRLEALGEGLWVAGAPHSFLGWRIGTRMTIVRLPDDTLLVHSPIPLDEELKRDIDSRGEVSHILAPSLYHHLFVGHCAGAYPEAKLHAAPGLEHKRRDLTFHATLGDEVDPAWGDELDAIHIGGTILGETVLLHRPTRTVISSDLVENFTGSDHLWTSLYLRASGIHGKIGLSRMLRPAFRDRRHARGCIDRVLHWDFDRVILAHGEPILDAGREAVRSTYEWLKA